MHPSNGSCLPKVVAVSRETYGEEPFRKSCCEWDDQECRGAGTNSQQGQKYLGGLNIAYGSTRRGGVRF